MSANFDSVDWIDDALDALNKSSFPYVLVVGIGPESTEVTSGGMSADDLNHISEVVRDHFDLLEDEEE